MADQAKPPVQAPVAQAPKAPEAPKPPTPPAPAPKVEPKKPETKVEKEPCAGIPMHVGAPKHCPSCPDALPGQDRPFHRAEPGK